MKASCPKVQSQGQPSNFRPYIEQQILNNYPLPWQTEVAQEATTLYAAILWGRGGAGWPIELVKISLAPHHCSSQERKTRKHTRKSFM